MANTMNDWIDHDLVDDSGSKIGKITDVYADTDTGKAGWITVSTGMFGSKSSFVPLSGLEASDDVLVSPWDKDKVKDAPNVDADGQISKEEENRLYSHYGVSGSGMAGAGNSGAPRADRTDQATRTTEGDMSVTRSEEELRVDKTEQGAGKVRLKKWVETEHQTITVPVRKEKVRVVRENLDGSETGGTIGGDEEQEITLSEEKVTVNKEVVGKERVSLEKDVETVDETVEGDVRKERVEVEGDGDITDNR